MQPEQRNNDFVNSLLAARRDSPYGVLPVWAFHGLETWCMIGYHAVPVIADAYMKGIRGYDADAALEAMVASASYGPYDGLAQYMELGYVPIDEEGEAASKTLEYAFDDWTIARMAEAMGRKDIAAHVPASAPATGATPSTPKTGFMRARKRDGSFREPFDPDRQRLRQRLHRRQRLAILLVRAAGRRRAWRRRTAATDKLLGEARRRCSTPRSIRRPSSTWRTSPA